MGNFGKLRESFKGTFLATALSIAAMTATSATAQNVNGALQSSPTFTSYSDAMKFASDRGLVFMHTSSNGHFFVSTETFNYLKDQVGDHFTTHSSGLIYILDKKIGEQPGGNELISVDLRIPKNESLRLLGESGESREVEQPVAEQPVAEQPVAEQPVAEQPVAEQPVAEQPVAEQPVAEQPVAEQPVVDEEDSVVVEQPVVAPEGGGQIDPEVGSGEGEGGGGVSGGVTPEVEEPNIGDANPNGDGSTWNGSEYTY